MKTIKEILIERDDISEQAAEDLINDARKDLYKRLEDGEDASDICFDWFGLEPDYLIDLIYGEVE